MTKPYPCISCCKVCTALFAENWAARLCAKGYNDPGLSASQNADNAAYIAAVNSYFNSISIASWTDFTWTDTTDYTAKYKSVLMSTPYPIHGQDIYGTVHSVTASSTGFNIGALWKTNHASSGDIPKKCAPGWFWTLTVLIDSTEWLYTILEPKNTVPSGGVVPATHAWGVNVPWAAAVVNTSSSIQCQDYDAAGENNTERLPTAQIRTTTGTAIHNPFNNSFAYLKHSTGAVTLPACPP